MASSLKTLTRKLQAILGQLPYLPQSFALVWTAARNWTIAWACLLVLQGLLPIATVYLSRALVDSLVADLGAGLAWERVRSTLGLVALLAGLMVLTELLRSVINWIRTAQSELVKDYISLLIYRQSISVDFAFYDSPEYYDQLHRARDDAYFRPVALLENGGSLLQNGITLLGMATVLLPFGLWLPLVLLLSTLPAFYVFLRYSLQQHRWWLQTTAADRRVWYYDWLLTARENAAELRLFGLGPHFQNSHQTLRSRLRRERLKLSQDQSLAEFSANAVTLSGMGLTLAWMVWQSLEGKVTLGDLVLFYQAFNQGQTVTRSLLQNLGEIYSNSLFLSNLFEFLALKPQVADPTHPIPIPIPLQEGICFRQVSFCYPNSERMALQDFSLMIPAGQIVAIVGNNGAGKSTLLKLLCRLYDPQAGSIEIDGTDIRCVSISELRHLITVLFQQPVYYSATAAENIALGDLTCWSKRPEIIAAAQAAGAEQPINRLPQGYDTLLGKWFEGGTDLSVGEWQRLALARAFLRQSAIIILDEPTSAMDSWAEADWLKQFRSLVAGRTAMIITHRFTTAMRADMIHVMVDGQIVESGCHDQLITQDGHYAQSWKAQMQEVRG